METEAGDLDPSSSLLSLLLVSVGLGDSLSLSPTPSVKILEGVVSD